MYLLNECPPSLIIIYVKDYIYSQFLSIAKVKQSKLTKKRLNTYSELGYPIEMTKKEYASFCLNYQFVDKKYWPNCVTSPNFKHCEDVINKLQIKTLTKSKEKMIKIEHKVNQLQRNNINNLPKPVNVNIEITKYSWIAVRGEELKTKKSRNYKATF